LQLHQPAIDDYAAALELDAMSAPLRATVLYNRGLSYHKLGDLPLAIEDYTSALLLDATMPYAFFSRGNALRESGQLLFALSDYERALQFNHPDKARVHYATALTYEALKRPRDVRRELSLALEIDPRHVAARKKLDEIGEQVGATVPPSDPILTGSVGAIGGTVLHKPDSVAAIEPTQALLEETAIPDAVQTVAVPGKIQDRLVPQDGGQEVRATLSVGAETAPDNSPVNDTVEPSGAAETQPEVQTSAVEPAPETQVVDNSTVEETAGWAVQLASASSEAAALSTWAKMQKRHAVLRSISPKIMRADLGGKGIFYRVRVVGFAEQETAKSLCKSFKRKGVTCYVSRAGT
jgi:tetratricopeptide (TPR) repeat protein